MALGSLLRSRKQQLLGNKEQPSNGSSPETRTSTGSEVMPKEGRQGSAADLKRTTRLRRAFVSVASFCYLISFIFLILVVIGNTSNKPVLRNVYFYRLSLADIIPTSVPNAQLINSIAQSIGLHDFYQVGLWNFCEGYQATGITYCSPTQSLYWFNPVEVLMSELLAGATIALPSEVITILNILRIASQVMFGFFLTAAVLSFVLVFVSVLAIRSRWWSLPLALLAFVHILLTVAASIVGSVISFVFKYALEAQSDLNIHASVGTQMFVFMWIATGFALIAFIAHAGMGCCCTSSRDVRVGRRPLKYAKTKQNNHAVTTAD